LPKLSKHFAVVDRQLKLNEILSSAFKNFANKSNDSRHAVAAFNSLYGISAYYNMLWWTTRSPFDVIYLISKS